MRRQKVEEKQLDQMQFSKAIGSSRLVPIASGPSKGPLDLLHLRAEVELRLKSEPIRVRRQYFELVDKVCWARSVHSNLPNIEEEQYAKLLDEWRACMTDEAQMQIEQLGAARRAKKEGPEVPLFDTMPADTDDVPLRLRQTG